jgi:NADH-quinone oxidoreductase subunit I
MNEIKEYFTDIAHGVKSLLKGMSVTGYYFLHPKEIITQQYPENRETLVIPERFRGELIMPHNEDNEHRCNGCSSCQLACPNGSIIIISDKIVNAEGKKKKIIDKYVYNLGMCTFCNLCVRACPTDALKMSNEFEHAAYDRIDLIKILNKPNSKVMEGVEE